MANDQVQDLMGQLNGSLAVLRTETVRIREAAVNLLSREFEGIDEYAFNTSTKTLTVIPEKPGPWMMTNLLIYTSGDTTTTLQLDPNEPGQQIPLPAGLTVWNHTKFLFRENIRPTLTDASAKKMWMRVQGYQIVTKADPV